MRRLLTSLSNHSQSQAKKIEELQEQILQLKSIEHKRLDVGDGALTPRLADNISDHLEEFNFTELIKLMYQAEKWEREGTMTSYFLM